MRAGGLQGSDSTGLSEPMRQQVEERSGQKVEQHLLDGGYLRSEDIEQAQGVELFVPPKPAKNLENRGRELEPQHGDSEAVLAWKRRMSPAEKQIYKKRAATSETVNADLRSYRGLDADYGTWLEKGKVRGAVVRAGLQRAALRYGVTDVSDPGQERRPRS